MAVLAACLTAAALALPASGHMGGTSDMPAGEAAGMAAATNSGMAHSGAHIMVPPPASIMGAVMIPKGAFIVNFVPMWMHMDGLRQGTGAVSGATVVTAVPNRFAGQPMPGYPMIKQPAYLRAVPTEMDMSAQMLGVMYGLTDSINLMLMGTYIQKDMTM